MSIIRECNDCGELILLARTGGGRWAVLDAVPHPLGSRVLDENGNAGPFHPGVRLKTKAKFRLHWATCSARTFG